MDWSKVYLLIEIALKTGGFPKLAGIHKAVNEELQRMNDEYDPNEVRKVPRDITPAGGPANAETKLPGGEIVQKPQQPLGPDGTVKTVKVDPLDKPTTLINEPVETERRL